MSLKDEHLMKKDSLIYSKLSEHATLVAKSRAQVLRDFEELAKANKAWLDAVNDRRDSGGKLQGCEKCKARWENPHADYHLSAVIDSDKI